MLDRMTIGKNIVEMEIAGLAGGLTKVTLSGRLDTPGIDRLEARFLAAVVSEGKSAIVDLSGVPFIGSMGIRMFITAARSMGFRRAKLALYGAATDGERGLRERVIDRVLPIVESEAEAITAVSP